MAELNTLGRPILGMGGYLKRRIHWDFEQNNNISHAVLRQMWDDRFSGFAIGGPKYCILLILNQCISS